MSGDRAAALRALFAQEAAERLDRLDAGLLRLEAAVTGGAAVDPEDVAGLFRDAHTVKGSAAMMRLPAVVALAHSLEDVLAEVRAGTRATTPALVTSLLAAVDALRRVVAAVLAGQDDRAAQESAAAVAALGAPPGPDGSATVRAPAPAAVTAAATAAAPVPVQPVPVPVPVPVQPAAPVREESLSVGVALLDELAHAVAAAAAGALQVGRLLREHGVDPQDSPDYRALSSALHSLQESTTRTRMVPVGSLSGRLHRVARDLSAELGRTLTWELVGGDTEVDRSLLGELVEALLHLVRNAVGHGLEPAEERVAAGKDPVGRLRLHAMRIGAEVVVTLTDDGRGLDLDALRRAAGVTDGGAELAFRPGVTTAGAVTDLSGRGVGLDAVRASLDRVRGRVEVSSTPGVGTEFRVVVPMSLSLLRCLEVTVGGQRFALPLASAVTSLPAAAVDLDDRVEVAGHRVPVVPLARVLGLPATTPLPTGAAVVVVAAAAGGRRGVLVDEVLGQSDVVVTALPPVLPRLPLYAGAGAGSGEGVLLVLDPTGVVTEAARLAPDVTTTAGPQAPLVLVVDDAAVVREAAQAMLTAAGYRVATAEDGEAGWARLLDGGVALLLTDLEMPRLDGLGLLARVRADPATSALAVVLVTSRASATDRARGLEAGADGYLDKAALDETLLLDTVATLLARVPV